MHDLIFTYLAHTIASMGYKGKARSTLPPPPPRRAQVCAYDELPLTSLDQAKNVNSVLLLRETDKSLFLWDACRGNRLETTSQNYVLGAPRVEN